MNLEYLNLNQTYLVGVSGGPDSMALLHALVSQHYQCYVAHVNYNLRPTSHRDQHIVEEFCKSHHIPCFVKTINTKPSGNLQAWARRIRYDFFEEIASTFQLTTVLIAHQKDDDIETYYMQKIQGKKPDYFGIRPTNTYRSLNIIRPMIHTSRDEVLKYCMEESIPYGIDETNNKPSYLRNRVRQELFGMTRSQKDALYDEMRIHNSDLTKSHSIAIDFLMNNSLKNGIKIVDILMQEEATRFEIINRILLENKGNQRYFRHSVIEGFMNWMNTSNNGDLWGVRQFTVVRQNDRIFLIDGLKKNELLTLESTISHGTIGGLTFTFSDLEGFYRIPVNDDDFPIKVMIPYPRGSRLELKDGHQKVSRFLINRKVPSHSRETIPVIINNRGVVIGIVGFYTQVRRKHMQHTLTVIK